MFEVNGNLWDYPADYRVITTNGTLKKSGELIMGAGLALQAKLRYPQLPVKLGGWVLRYGSRVFLLKEEGLIAFPTKYNWRDKSRVYIIENSVQQIVDLVDKFGIKSVAMPRPGCGCGALTWEVVKPLLIKLDNRFTVVSQGED